MGLHEGAFAVLQLAFPDAPASSLRALAHSPFLARLAADPQWEALLEKTHRRARDLAQAPRPVVPVARPVDTTLHALVRTVLRAREARDRVVDHYSGQSWVATYASHDPLAIAEAFAFTQQQDEAFIWVRTAFRRGHGMEGLAQSRFLKPLAGQRRWTEMLERMGRAPWQLPDTSELVVLQYPAAQQVEPA